MTNLHDNKKLDELLTALGLEPGLFWARAAILKWLHSAVETSGDRCIRCSVPLPPVSAWSGPACPTCTEEAERLTLLEARLGTILNIVEGELTAKAQQYIARLAREVVRPAENGSPCR